MKPDIRTVAPVKGRRVRQPGGRLLEAPTPVTWSSYWARLVRDNDVTIVPAAPTPAAPTAGGATGAAAQKES